MIIIYSYIYTLKCKIYKELKHKSIVNIAATEILKINTNLSH